MAPSWMEKFIVRADPPLPDPIRTSSHPHLSLEYSALAEHHRILTAPGSPTPRYQVSRKAMMGGIWGSKCTVTTPSSSQKIALIDFHTFHYTIDFPLRNHRIEISTAKRIFNGSGGLGELRWKATGMEAAGAASWDCAD